MYQVSKLTSNSFKITRIFYKLVKWTPYKLIINWISNIMISIWRWRLRGITLNIKNSYSNLVKLKQNNSSIRFSKIQMLILIRLNPEEMDHLIIWWYKANLKSRLQLWTKGLIAFSQKLNLEIFRKIRLMDNRITRKPITRFFSPEQLAKTFKICNLV